MTSTAPSAASPGTTDGPPVPYAIQAVLQLANRLDEEAGWRDVSSLRKKATSVRRDLGKIDTAEADLETVRIRCMVLVSQILSAKSIPPEAEAECWITLAELHELVNESTDFRGRAADLFLVALEEFAGSEHPRTRMCFPTSRKKHRSSCRARLLLRLAEQRAAEGRWKEAAVSAKEAQQEFVRAGESKWAERCHSLHVESTAHRFMRTTPNMDSTSPLIGRVEPARTVTQSLGSARRTNSARFAESPQDATTTTTVRARSRHKGAWNAPRIDADLFAAIRDLRTLPLEEMRRIDATRRKTAGISLDRAKRARLDAAIILTKTAMTQTEVGNYADALLVYAMARPLWTGIEGTELTRAACNHSLSTTYAALDKLIEADAAAQAAHGLVSIVPQGESYRGTCLTRVNDLRSVVEERYPRLNSGESGPTTMADMLLTLTECAFRLVRDEHHNAELDSDVLRSTMKMAHRARLHLEPRAAWTTTAKIKLARCDFILGTCMVLAIGHRHISKLPIRTEEPWISFLSSSIFAETGAVDTRGARGSISGSSRSGDRRGTSATALDSQCAAIVSLMAGLEDFTEMGGHSTTVKDSLEIFLTVSMKARAA